ncbi:retrovirus-related pol polyprotein from transposon TNT 1-94 [Tanacetum coccineum]
MASTLMKKLSNMTLDKVKGVREHIMEMRDIASKLSSLKVEISESFLVHFILNSLPLEYTPFKISYNTHKENWAINDLLTMCVPEELRLELDPTYEHSLLTMHEVGTKRCIINEKSSSLCHRRLGHISVERMKRLINDEALPALDFTDLGLRFYCPSHTPKVVEARNANFLEEHEVSRSDSTQQLHFEEVRDEPNIPLHVESLVRNQYNVENHIEEQPNEHPMQEEIHLEQINVVQPDVVQPGVVQPDVVEPNVVEHANPSTLKIVGVRRSSRTKRSAIPSDYVVYLQESDYHIGPKKDPISFSQAMNQENSSFWYDAMNEEMESMIKNKF